MALKKCVSCGSVWSSALVRCAFCGGEAQEQDVPKVVVKPKSERDAETAEAETEAEAAVLPRELPSDTDRPLTRLAEPQQGVSATTFPAGSQSASAVSPAAPLREIEERPADAPTPEPVRVEPPKPALPSATAAMTFASLSLVGCAALPLVIGRDGATVLGVPLDVLALFAAGAFGPLAPLAWISGGRTERKQRTLELGTFWARMARRMGAALTFVAALEFAALAAYVAAMRLGGRLAEPLFSGGIR